MKKRFALGTVIALMILVAATTFTLTYVEVRNDFNRRISERTETEKQLAKFIEIREAVNKSFIGEYDESKMLDGAMAGIIDSLNDRWSYYLSAEEYKRYLDMNNNEYVGIGVTCRYDEDSGEIRIEEIYEGTPAAAAGVRSGDVIVEVDGEPVHDLSYDQVVSRVKGAEGTEVTLKLRRAAGLITLTIERQKIHMDVIHSEILPGNIGYVKISNFDSNQFIEFELAVNRLVNADVRGIVFDVRFNPGGQLKELLRTLDMLLPEGVIFNSRSKDGKEESYSSTAGEINLPMAVIINAGSYSAAEYFAAALQEYEWAAVVGTKTTGKGYSQIPIPLSDGSAIVLSTNEYFTPNGVSIALTGVTPDIPVDLTESQLYDYYNNKLPRDRDPQLIKAIEAINAETERREAEAAEAEAREAEAAAAEAEAAAAKAEDE